MAQLTSHLTNGSKDSVKSKPNEMDSCIPTGTHNDNIKGTSDGKNDDILLELDIPASDREFSEENEVTNVGSSINSDVSSPEFPYVSLKDDKLTIEETDKKTEEPNAELNDAIAIIEIPRKRGRPRGTFGKKKGKEIKKAIHPKEIKKALQAVVTDINNVTSQQIPRKRGRPRGTFGKEKGKEIVKALQAMVTDTNNVTSQDTTPRKRGRPLGTFGRVKQNTIIKALKAKLIDANHGASQQIPRKRGRPRGSFGKEKGKKNGKALQAMVTDTNNVTSQETPTKKGRPLGSIGKKKT